MAAAVVAATAAASLAGFELAWKRSALEDLFHQPGGLAGALAIVAASAAVHEGLHAAGWKALGRTPWSTVSIRRTWRVMGWVARIEQPVSAHAYRAGLAAPAVLMGALPIAAGLATNRGLLVLWAQFFLLECFSDLASLFATGGLPADARVRSHPTRLGGEVAGAPMP